MKFDTKIHQRLNADNRRCEGSKTSPQDWADMLEEDPDLAEELKRVFNNYDIPEADDFPPELIEDTYVDMEIAVPRYLEGPEFSKVKNVCGVKMLSQ